MQQKRRTAPPPPKSLALAVLLVGVLVLVIGGRTLWSLIAPDPAEAGRERLADAGAALMDQKPNRAARLAAEAAALFEQTPDGAGLFQATALSARALQAAGRSTEAAAALAQAIALRHQGTPDPQGLWHLAELFFALKRYGLASDYAADAGQALGDAALYQAGGEALTAFAGRLAVADARREAVRLYADAIDMLTKASLEFEVAQVYERIGITLAPIDPEGAYAGYVEAINRLGLMGREDRAEAVVERVRQLPQSFLETIDE
jgi:tetratricopeptide (TPR) repeat protein